MSGLEKKIDVTRPENYRLRCGHEVLGLYERRFTGVIVVFKTNTDEVNVADVDKYGFDTEGFSDYDLIERPPKKLWKNVYAHGGEEVFWDESKQDADDGAYNGRIGYLTATNEEHFSTYELVPLGGED